MKLTSAQFQAITRYHFGLGPKPWIGHPHISLADLGRSEFDRVTQWWSQWAMWNAWLESGKKGPRPKAWRLSLPVSPFAWQLRREWRKAHWSPPPAPGPTPPPPPSSGPLPARYARYQRASIGAQNPMDALMWHNCKLVGFTADPNSAYGQWVTRANGDLVRRAGKEPFVWYVPDQISHERAQECARILGTDGNPCEIWCDVELLDRYRRAWANGVRVGIANLSALWEDPEANARIANHEFVIINEHYWNQSRRRVPDNHNLPVASMCIAVYDGHSDSQEADAFEPDVADYEAAGYLWPTVCVYSVNMTPADWARMP